jgi:hypothetical protein
VSLPGLLIEYLITGAVAIVWIWTLASAVQPGSQLNLKDFGAAHVTLAVPLAYVLGMVVDYVGRLLATAIRRGVADPVNCRLGPAIARHVPAGWVAIHEFLAAGSKPSVAPLMQAEILIKSTELGKQYEMRSSRDRIARGMLANVTAFALGGAVVGARLGSIVTIWGRLSIAAILLSFAVWFRFHELTNLFINNAAKALERNAQDNRRG